MRKVILLLSVLFIFSCRTQDTEVVIQNGRISTNLSPRSSFSAIWDICKPTREANAGFRVFSPAGSSNQVLQFTPSSGSPNCGDDGSGTIASQAQVEITINSGSVTFSGSVLNLPPGSSYSIRQYTTGDCQTHGFDWTDVNCLSQPMGDIYIKSQVSPSCTPYVTNTTCIQITPL